MLLMFFLALVHGLLVSLTMDAGLNNILRDVIPFVFLLIYYPLAKIKREDREAIYISILFCGLFLTLRFFLKAEVNILSLLGKTLADKQYLIQDPAVLFATIFSAKKMIDMFEDNKILASMIFFCSFIFGLLGFILMGVRAGAGISVMYLVFTVMRMQTFPVLRYVWLVALVFSLLFSVDLFIALIEKFQTFGLNNKDREFVAVFDFLGNTIFSSFLGVGFGGTFLNPVYGIEIRYTHNILSYFYLKLGILGLIFSTTFILMMLVQALDLAKRFLFFEFGRRERTRAALFCALLPSLFLQPTYKSYTFALLVSLFLMEVVDARRSHTYKE